MAEKVKVLIVRNMILGNRTYDAGQVVELHPYEAEQQEKRGYCRRDMQAEELGGEPKASTRRESITEDNAEALVPPKRRRGRPRKHPEKEDVAPIGN